MQCLTDIVFEPKQVPHGPWRTIRASSAPSDAGQASRKREGGLRRHLETARELAAAIVALGDVPPRLLAPADRIAAAIGLEPGPELGRLVAALQEEQAAGAIATEDEAVAFAREFIAAG